MGELSKEPSHTPDNLPANQRTVVISLENRLKAEFGEEGSGHDWAHLDRVRSTALGLARNSDEPMDIFVVETAALLHDYKDDKVVGNEARPSVRHLLTTLGVNEVYTDSIATITENISFRKRHERQVTSVEGQIVEDADRLEAIGAIGIARAFTFGGSKGNSIAETIKHFAAKLLLLKDTMNTPAGRRMAEGRHEFMVTFLEQFDAETKRKR